MFHSDIQLWLSNESIQIVPYRTLVRQAILAYCCRKAAAVSDSRFLLDHLTLFYTAFFLSAVNGCCGYCAAADKEQRDPQEHIAVVAGFR